MMRERCTASSVFYDGACPLCEREIWLYRGLPPTEPVVFVDISSPSQPPPLGKSRQASHARFHVQHADGRSESGPRAFIGLWA